MPTIEFDLTTPEGRAAYRAAVVGKDPHHTGKAAQKPAQTVTAASKQSRRGAGPRLMRAIVAGWQFGVKMTDAGERGYGWRGNERTPLLPVGGGEATSAEASAGEQWGPVLDWIEERNR